MKPSLSWIDPEALDRLLVAAGFARPRAGNLAAPEGTRAVPPALEPPPVAPEPPAPPAPQTSAPEPPALAPVAVASPAPPSPAVATGSSVLPGLRLSVATSAPTEEAEEAVSTVVEAAPFEPPRGSLDERLEALLEWVRDSHPEAETVFIADSDGLPLAGGDANDALAAASSGVGSMLQAVGTVVDVWGEGALSIDLAPERTLHIVRAATDWGPVCLGLVVSESVERRRIHRFQQALERTLRDRGLD